MKEGSAAAGAAADGTREGGRLRISKRSPGSFYIRGQDAISGRTDENIPFAQGERGIFFNLGKILIKKAGFLTYLPNYILMV